MHACMSSAYFRLLPRHYLQSCYSCVFVWVCDYRQRDLLPKDDKAKYPIGAFSVVSHFLDGGNYGLWSIGEWERRGHTDTTAAAITATVISSMHYSAAAARSVRLRRYLHFEKHWQRNCRHVLWSTEVISQHFKRNTSFVKLSLHVIWGICMHQVSFLYFFFFSFW